MEELVRVRLMLNLLFRITILFFGSLAVLSLGIMILQSFLEAPFFERNLIFTLNEYISTFIDRDFHKALIGSLIVAILTLLALPIALFFAVVIHKIEGVYGYRVIEPILIIPMFISPLIWGFAWLYAYGPVGILPNFWGDLYGLVQAGIISALVHVPNAYTVISSAILGVDSSYEEVARIHGARALYVILKILIPMIRPAVVFSAILLFILGMEQFGIPLLFYTSVGGYVLTTYLYKLQVISLTPDYSKEAVVASTTVYIAISLLLLQRYLTIRYSKRYGVIGSRVRGVLRISVSPIWRALLSIITILYITFTIIIPLISLTMRSFNIFYGTTKTISLVYYETIFTSEWHRRLIINTLGVSILAASLGLLASIAFSRAIYKGGALESRFCDAVSTLPRAMPGLVLGLAFLWIYLFTPLKPLMYTLLGLAIPYVVMWSIMGTRVVLSSMTQISSELEEIARIHGASDSIVLRKITLPLIKRSILLSWLIMFIYGIRDYSTAMFLVTPQTMVIGPFLIMAYGGGEMGIIAALSSIQILIILIATLAIFRLGWKPYG